MARRFKYLDAYKSKPRFCKSCGAAAIRIRDNYCHRCKPLKLSEEIPPDDEIAGIGNYGYELAAKRMEKLREQKTYE
jgi:hypothetical protein